MDRSEVSNKFIGEEETLLGASERTACSPMVVLLSGLLLVFACGALLETGR